MFAAENKNEIENLNVKMKHKLPEDEQDELEKLLTNFSTQVNKPCNNTAFTLNLGLQIENIRQKLVALAKNQQTDAATYLHSTAIILLRNAIVDRLIDSDGKLDTVQLETQLKPFMDLLKLGNFDQTQQAQELETLKKTLKGKAQAKFMDKYADTKGKLTLSVDRETELNELKSDMDNELKNKIDNLLGNKTKIQVTLKPTPPNDIDVDLKTNQLLDSWIMKMMQRCDNYFRAISIDIDGIEDSNNLVQLEQKIKESCKTELTDSPEKIKANTTREAKANIFLTLKTDLKAAQKESNTLLKETKVQNAVNALENAESKEILEQHQTPKEKGAISALFGKFKAFLANTALGRQCDFFKPRSQQYKENIEKDFANLQSNILPPAV